MSHWDHMVAALSAPSTPPSGASPAPRPKSPRPRAKRSAQSAKGQALAVVGAKRMVAVNSRGQRIGEDRHNAKLTNAQVDDLLALLDGARRMRERERVAQGLTFAALARRFGLAKSTVHAIATGKRRAGIPDRYVPVRGAVRAQGLAEHTLSYPGI